jgi:hypothetical protein
MDCLIPAIFPPFASRPPKGGAGIAGKPGSPEKYENGNRGKVKSRPSFGTKGGSHGNRPVHKMRL